MEPFDVVFTPGDSNRYVGKSNYSISVSMTKQRGEYVFKIITKCRWSFDKSTIFTNLDRWWVYGYKTTLKLTTTERDYLKDKLVEWIGSST